MTAFTFDLRIYKKSKPAHGGKYKCVREHFVADSLHEAKRKMLTHFHRRGWFVIGVMEETDLEFKGIVT